MLISIKLCNHIIGRIDGELAEIPRMLQLSQYILGNSLYIRTLTVSAHLKSEGRYHEEVSASIARMWQMLCSEYPFYAQNTRFTTVIIDKPTGHQCYVIE
jgi:hypothetical protein